MGHLLRICLILKSNQNLKHLNYFTWVNDEEQNHQMDTMIKAVVHIQYSLLKYHNLNHLLVVILRIKHLKVVFQK